MACGSGCCKAPHSAPLERNASLVPPISDNAESCCNNEDLTENMDTTCQDACCDRSTDDMAGELKLRPLEAPSCCKSKPFPCCDSSCIDRIALRECYSQLSVTSPLQTTFADLDIRIHNICQARNLYTGLERRTMPPALYQPK